MPRFRLPHQVLVATVAVLVALPLVSGDAVAKKRRHVAVRAAPSEPAFNDKYSAFVVDAKTGKVLYAEQADVIRYPASLTKMMTLYVLFEELQAGRMSLDTDLKVSSSAAAQAPSKLGLLPGSTIRVEDAIKAVTVKSANDAAWAIAENVSGSIPTFAARMTRTAHALGMTRTQFSNPNGLPDPRNVTTARDMATLGRALQDRFPTYYKYFGAPAFAYGRATYQNHDKLLGRVDGVDGIKTGYIRASGFNLVTNVNRDGQHIVGVVMGGRTGAARDAQMRQLIVQYLPSASHGPRTVPVLVADASQQQFAEQIAATPTRLPRTRPELEELPAAAEGDLVAVAPVTVASISVAPSAKSRAKAGAPSDQIGTRISNATEVAELAYAPEFGSGDDPIARLTELAHARKAGGSAPVLAQDVGETRDLVAASDGWTIQIGAVPTAEGAQALLDKTASSMGTVLAAADPVTQPVQKNGATIYRARFTGFAGKEDARAACAKLKTKAISCLAVPN